MVRKREATKCTGGPTNNRTIFEEQSGKFQKPTKGDFFFLLQVFYAKEKGKRTWEEGKEKRERNLMKGIFVHSHLNCPKTLPFEKLSQKSFNPPFLSYFWQFPQMLLPTNGMLIIVLG